MNYQEELKDLLGAIARESASDLHLSEGRHPTIRINSALLPLVKKAPLTHEDIVGLLTVMLGKDKEQRFVERKEFDFSYQFTAEHRFRGNAFVQQGAYSVALRLIPKQILTIAELGLPPMLENFARKKQGFFLVVGPVGQGKSTTLAAMIELINQERAEHIITIEDPTEISERSASIPTASSRPSPRSSDRT